MTYSMVFENYELLDFFLHFWTTFQFLFLDIVTNIVIVVVEELWIYDIVIIAITNTVTNWPQIVLIMAMVRR